jgi:cytochrome c oxidase assembly protein subunit 11
MSVRNDRRVAFGAVLIIAVMVGLTAASVPLYNLFCRVTGYGGTTQRAEAPSGAVVDREVEVYFNADIDPHLPWQFRPVQRSQRVKLGESSLAFFEAVNLSDHPVVGSAVYNVTPHKVGYYFTKLQCFCFDEQVLQPGERVDMPVTYFVDPELLDDPNTLDVTQITLSYTFFIDEEATAKLSESPDGTS